MLMIGSPKIDELCKLIDASEGTFVFVKKEGLSVYVDHTLPSDEAAKTAAKQMISASPTLSRFFSSVKIIDAKGNIL